MEGSGKTPRYRDDYDPSRVSGKPEMRPEPASVQQPKKATSILGSAYTWLTNKFGKAGQVDKVYLNADKAAAQLKDNEKKIAGKISVLGYELHNMNEKMQKEGSTPELESSFSKLQDSYIRIGKEFDKFINNHDPAELENLQGHLEEVSAEFDRLDSRLGGDKIAIIFGALKQNEKELVNSGGSLPPAVEMYEKIQDTKMLLHDMHVRLKDKPGNHGAADELAGIEARFSSMLIECEDTFGKDRFQPVVRGENPERSAYCKSVVENLNSILNDLGKFGRELQ